MGRGHKASGWSRGSNGQVVGGEAGVEEGRSQRAWETTGGPLSFILMGTESSWRALN